MRNSELFLIYLGEVYSMDLFLLLLDLLLRTLLLELLNLERFYTFRSKPVLFIFFESIKLEYSTSCILTKCYLSDAGYK